MYPISLASPHAAWCVPDLRDAQWSRADSGSRFRVASFRQRPVGDRENLRDASHGVQILAGLLAFVQNEPVRPSSGFVDELGGLKGALPIGDALARGRVLGHGAFLRRPNFA